MKSKESKLTLFLQTVMFRHQHGKTTEYFCSTTTEENKRGRQ